jgi:hypothetical protein
MLVTVNRISDQWLGFLLNVQQIRYRRVMKRKLTRTIHAHRIKRNARAIDGDFPYEEYLTTIAPPAVLEYEGRRRDNSQVSIKWKYESYVIWKDDWENATEEALDN